VFVWSVCVSLSVFVSLYVWGVNDQGGWLTGSEVQSIISKARSKASSTRHGTGKVAESFVSGSEGSREKTGASRERVSKPIDKVSYLF